MECVCRFLSRVDYIGRWGGGGGKMDPWMMTRFVSFANSFLEWFDLVIAMTQVLFHNNICPSSLSSIIIDIRLWLCSLSLGVFQIIFLSPLTLSWELTLYDEQQSHYNSIESFSSYPYKVDLIIPTNTLKSFINTYECWCPRRWIACMVLMIVTSLLPRLIHLSAQPHQKPEIFPRDFVIHRDESPPPPLSRELPPV
jgi:hypothetical protein